MMQYNYQPQQKLIISALGVYFSIRFLLGWNTGDTIKTEVDAKTPLIQWDLNKIAEILIFDNILHNQAWMNP